MTPNWDWPVGASVGAAVGPSVGAAVGASVGAAVGAAVGSIVGGLVGVALPGLHWLYHSLVAMQVEPDSQHVGPLWFFPPHCCHTDAHPPDGVEEGVAGVAVGVGEGVGVAVGEGAEPPGLHCEYHSLLYTQVEPDVQQVGPLWFLPPH